MILRAEIGRFQAEKWDLNEGDTRYEGKKCYASIGDGDIMSRKMNRHKRDFNNCFFADLTRQKLHGIRMESWGIPLDFSHEMDRFLLKPMATLLRE